MLKDYPSKFAVLAMSLVLAGCAIQRPIKSFDALDLNPKLQSGQLHQKINNFLIMYDNSESLSVLFTS
jgi:hypothetical protein